MAKGNEPTLAELMREELNRLQKYDIEVCVLIVRNTETGGLIFAQSLSDSESEASVEYYPENIPSIDVLKEALKNRSDALKQLAYFNYIEGKPFTISGQACYLPSIGNIKVTVEYKKMTIE